MLRSAIDRAAEHFASACGSQPSRRELRDRADDLVLELLQALRVASLAEIADAVAVLTRRQKARSVAADADKRLHARTGKSRSKRVAAEPRALTPTRSATTPARTPFDITMPSELLAPAGPSSEPGATEARVEAQAAQAPAPTPRSDKPDKPERSTPEQAPDSSRSPRVALREGEELVRSGGSGAIIRRTRTA
jgi:hypothetical protein